MNSLCNFYFFEICCRFPTCLFKQRLVKAQCSVVMISLICKKGSSGGNIQRISGDRFVPYH